MKIIDILNKIANNEQPPKRIVFRNEVYEYDEQDGDYRNKNYDALFDYHEITDILNEEVQILETTITYKQDNKIGKINIDIFDDNEITNINKMKHLAIRINEIIDKFNEIIEVINER